MNKASETRPSLLSKEGFKGFLSAFKIKQYSTRDWGVWCLSSIASDLKYVIGGALFYVWNTLPLVVTSTIKSIGVKVAALAVACFEVFVVS